MGKRKQKGKGKVVCVKKVKKWNQYSNEREPTRNFVDGWRKVEENDKF